MPPSPSSGSYPAPYLEGVERGVLRYQLCEDCGAAQVLTRYACMRCAGERLAWRDAAGTGTVYAITLVMRAPSEEFRALIPYALVLVNLDEGARVMAHGSPDLHIGERVRARFVAFGDRHLVQFQRECGDG
jgi:uncharacterized OB-fold protein